MTEQAGTSERSRSVSGIHRDVCQLLELLPRDNRGSCRIELCGGIGVGKTTVATALAKVWSLPLFFEAFEQVPFWEKYYRDPAEYQLEKDVSFLLSYGDIIRNAALNEVGSTPKVFDFSLLQILAYCDLSQSPADMQAIEQLYARIAQRCGPPSLVLHVSCPIEEQLRRISVRGRELEVNVDIAFHMALNERIAVRRAGHGMAIPVLEIDSFTADFSANPEREALRLAERLSALMRQPFSS